MQNTCHNKKAAKQKQPSYSEQLQETIDYLGSLEDLYLDKVTDLLEKQVKDSKPLPLPG